ncbi:formylglycine-generating enzyme family protein [Pseudoduganella sp. HUAS MS19]
MKFPLMLALAGLLAHDAMAVEVISPALVKVPAGRIETGACPDGKQICPEPDYVRQLVEVNAFEIGATEVTFAEWDACVKDNACTSPVSDWAYENRPVVAPCVQDAPCQYPADQGWGRGKRPVINVSWDDVQGYLKWLNAKTGQRYRLPTSAEWEHAALAGAATGYPWGEKLGKNNANCGGCGSKWDNRQTAPVASFKPNRFGIHDMSGNVAEWVSSCFPSREPGSQECKTYIYRGGSWQSVAKAMDPRGYDALFGNLRHNYIGFRLAR